MAQLSAPQLAGILSGDHRFAQFIRERHGFEGEGANFIRGYCNIASRRDLASDDVAQAKFDALRTEFDAWRGALAAPR